MRFSDIKARVAEFATRQQQGAHPCAYDPTAMADRAELVKLVEELAAALKALSQRYNDRKGIPYLLDRQCQAALAKVQP